MKMSPISWPQWFPASTWSKGRITGCHHLITYFRVSLHALYLLRDFACPLWSCPHPLSPPFFFTPPLLPFSFSQQSFSFLSALAVFNSFTPFHFHPCVPFYTLASLHHSDSFLLCFPSASSAGGGAAGPLCPGVRPGNHRGRVWCGRTVWHSAGGRSHPEPSRTTCLRAPPGRPSAPTGTRASSDNYTTNSYRRLVSLRRRGRGVIVDGKQH